MVETLKTPKTETAVVNNHRVVDNLDRFVQTRAAEVFRPDQQNVFSSIHQFFANGERLGYIEAPTGFGKTRLFSALVDASQTQSLVLEPTIELVTQTKEKLLELNADLPVGVFYSKEKDLSNQVTVITYNSCARLVDSGAISASFAPLVIADEVHRSLSKQRKNMVNFFHSSVVIGFTATSEFSPQKTVGEVFGRKIHQVGLEEAIEIGVLTPLRGFLVRTGVDVGKISTVETRFGADYKPDQLDKKLNIKSRNQAAVDFYKKYFSEPIRPAIAFAVSVDHAHQLAQEFNRHNIPSAAVDGRMDPVKRKDVLTAYKNGQIEVICTRDLLVEGWDSPRTEVALNLRPTTSLVVAKQRLGRVLRPSPETGKQYAYVVEFLDNFVATTPPITVFEIFGVKQFKQGGFIAKPHNFYPEHKGYHRDKDSGEVILDDIPIDTKIEDILVVDRQKQSVDARLRLLRAGLLDDDQIKVLRSDLTKILVYFEKLVIKQGIYDLREIATSLFNALRIETSEFEGSMASILRRFRGSERTDDLNHLLDFVAGADYKPESTNHHERRASLPENMQRIAAGRLSKRELPKTQEQLRGLIDQLKESGQELNSMRFCGFSFAIGQNTMSGQTILRRMFGEANRRSFDQLLKIAGIEMVDGYDLLDQVKKYSAGDLSEDKQARLRKELVRVMDELQSQGIDFQKMPVAYMNPVKIQTSAYQGRFSRIIRYFDIPANNQKASESRGYHNLTTFLKSVPRQ